MIYQEVGEYIVRNLQMYGFDGELLAKSGMGGAPSYEDFSAKKGWVDVELARGERIVGI